MTGDVTETHDDAFIDALGKEILGHFESAAYEHDPVAWVNDVLDEELWSKEREVIESVRANKKTAVKSCHGVGKSHTASRLALWWLAAHPPGTAFVVTTAPTYAQVRAILWRYIRQGHKKASLIGKLNQTEWFIDGEIVAFGRKPGDTDEAAFQGIHARYVLVILDEACGIPESLWVAADALTTNDDCRMLAIGNPDNPASHFRKVCESDSWHVIRINAYDSPNLTDEAVSDELRMLLVGRSWVEEKAREWGEDNPLYISKVLGDFPTDNPHAVIRASDVAKCRYEPDNPWPADMLMPTELGVDVGGGQDETVIRERRGLRAGREWRSREDKSEKVADLIFRCIVETSASAVKIDTGGIGWGVVGHVREKCKTVGVKCRVVPINFGEKPSEPKKFLNLRAELWWMGRELSEAQEWDLSGMENADKTVAQLLEPQWDLDPKGKIRVEPKDDVIDRLGRSPDNADALLLAFFTKANSGSAFLAAWQAMAEKAGLVTPAADDETQAA